MFIAHYGVSFAAKKAAPEAPLWLLILSGQFLDLIWPIFVVLGIERLEITPGITAVNPLDFTYYPYSHSLLLAGVWAALVGLLSWRWLRSRRTGAVAAACVLSHWFLDLIVHRPDLPLTPFNAVVFGFGVWNSLPATLALESIFFATGVWIYARATEPKRGQGTWALASLVVFLAVIYALNLFGPPPPDPKAVGFTALAAWLFPLWGYWLDRTRRTR